jgi:hypothetical protein
MRRIATIMAGAVLALAQAGQGEPNQAQAFPAPGDGKAHYDKRHHDQPGENNCTKFRDQCKYDASCDCYYRLSSPPPKSDSQPPQKSSAQSSPDRGAHSAPSQGQRTSPTQSDEHRAHQG